MAFLVAGLLIIGAITIAGGGHTLSGLGKDTRNASDEITRNANE